MVLECGAHDKVLPIMLVPRPCGPASEPALREHLDGRARSLDGATGRPPASLRFIAPCTDPATRHALHSDVLPLRP